MQQSADFLWRREQLEIMHGFKLLDPKQQIPSKMPLRAPNSGVVVTKNVSLGDRVNLDEAAYVLAGICDVNSKNCLASSRDFSVSVTLKKPQAVLRPGIIGRARISVK